MGTFISLGHLTCSKSVCVVVESIYRWNYFAQSPIQYKLSKGPSQWPFSRWPRIDAAALSSKWTVTIVHQRKGAYMLHIWPHIGRSPLEILFYSSAISLPVCVCVCECVTVCVFAINCMSGCVSYKFICNITSEVCKIKFTRRVCRGRKKFYLHSRQQTQIFLCVCLRSLCYYFYFIS